VGRRRHAFALPCPARGGKARTAGRSHDLLEAAQADRPPRLQVQRDKVVQQKRTLARRRRAFDQRQAPRRRRLRVPLERRRQVLEHFFPFIPQVDAKRKAKKKSAQIIKRDEKDLRLSGYP